MNGLVLGLVSLLFCAWEGVVVVVVVSLNEIPHETVMLVVAFIASMNA